MRGHDVRRILNGGFFNRPGWPDRQPKPEPEPEQDNDEGEGQ